MKQGQENNNYLNENYLRLDGNSIKEIDSNFKSVGLKSNPQEIAHPKYWYELHDMFNILRDKIDTKMVDIILPESLLINDRNRQSLKETLSIECKKLKSNDKKAAVLPINLGNKHWTTLIITKDQDNGLIFTYNNSDGSPINPNLKKILKEVDTNSTIIDLETKQQWNDFDCGPITIDNLVKTANGEDITRVNQNTTTAYGAKLRQEHAKIIEEQQRREAIQQQAQYQQLPPAPPPVLQVNQQQQQAQYQQLPPAPPPLLQVNQQQQQAQYPQLPPAPPPILQVNQQQQQFSPQQTQQIPQKISIMAAVGNSLKDIVKTIKRNPIKSAAVGIIGTITIVGTGGAAVPLIATIGTAAIVGKVIKDVGETIYKNWNANRPTSNKPSYKPINKKKFNQQQKQQSQVNKNFVKNTPIQHGAQQPTPKATPIQPKSSNSKQNAR